MIVLNWCVQSQCFFFQQWAFSCRTFTQQVDHNLTCTQFSKIDFIIQFLKEKKFLNRNCQIMIVPLRSFDVKEFDESSLITLTQQA